MRGTLGVALGLLVVAGSLFTGRQLDAHALGGLNTVTVSPVHGKAAVPFQVTYAISPCTSAAGLTIGFSWGALPPAGQVLGTATTDSSCRATLSTKPPVNSATHQLPAAGSYQLFGYVALPTGIATPNTEASVSYTLDVTPLPTASRSATAKPSASGNTATSASASAPEEFPAQPTATAHKPARSWTLSWTLSLGLGLLALATLAAIPFLIGAMVRRRRARAAQGLSEDKAA